MRMTGSSFGGVSTPHERGRKRHANRCGTMPADWKHEGAEVALSCRAAPVRTRKETIMTEETSYAKTAPTRAEVDALAGAWVLEFGTDWCGYCQGAQPHIAESLARAPHLRHLKIEDGPGRPLGRSFKVKLWPTLIFLRDGVEVARVVRPNDARAVDEGVAALA
jgi:thioredoxin 1